MDLTIGGTIRREDTLQGIPNVTVAAYDADLFTDDLLGTAKTDAEGVFAIACRPPGGPMDRPDIYLQVKSEKGMLIHSTRHCIVYDVAENLDMTVTVATAALIRAGLEAPAHRSARPSGSAAEKSNLKTWSLRPDGDPDNPLLQQTFRQLERHDSILDLFHTYKQTLDRSADNNDPLYGRLGALFNAGRTPEIVQGHFYGITLGVRCGEMPEAMADFGNLLGLIWGATLSDECPWVGKSLEPLSPSKLQALTGETAPAGTIALLGINHFNRIPTRTLNALAFQLLNAWMNLHPAPETEQRDFNWEKNGGNFIGRPALSICAQSPRPVFQLNYRYPALNNPVPNRWLVDELVEIAPGLYLGQLCYATKKLLRDFDPRRPPREYRYQNFGYFLLLDRTWHAEARRLFTYLEIPPHAPGVQVPGTGTTL